MAIDPVEETAIRAFVIPAKRDRMITLLGSGTRRRKAAAGLDHFNDWDMRHGKAMGPGESLLDAMRRAGAAGNCRIISADAELDEKEMALVDAVAAVEGSGCASLICCNGGRVAAFKDENDVPTIRVVFVK